MLWLEWGTLIVWTCFWCTQTKSNPKQKKGGKRNMIKSNKLTVFVFWIPFTLIFSISAKIILVSELLHELTRCFNSFQFIKSHSAWGYTLPSDFFYFFFSFNYFHDTETAYQRKMLTKFSMTKVDISFTDCLIKIMPIFVNVSN